MFVQHSVTVNRAACILRLTAVMHPCRQEAWGRCTPKHAPRGTGGAAQGPSLLTLLENAKAVLHALAHVHHCGVLHRGLTPDHVLVTLPPPLPPLQPTPHPIHLNATGPVACLTTITHLPVSHNLSSRTTCLVCCLARNKVGSCSLC